LPPHLAAVAGGRNFQSNSAKNISMNAQTLAAQRDVQIGQQMIAPPQLPENSRQQVRNDVHAVQAYNTNLPTGNNQVLPILTDLTGRDLGNSGEAWQAWWTDQRGYAYSSQDPSTKPTYSDVVLNPVVIPHHSCFGAGTLVQTLKGPQAIESINVGEQVLTQ